MRSGQPAGAGTDDDAGDDEGDDEGEGACLGAGEDEDWPLPVSSDVPL